MATKRRRVGPRRSLVAPRAPWEEGAASDEKLARLFTLKYLWGATAPRCHLVPRLVESFEERVASMLVGVSRALHAVFGKYPRLCKADDPKVNLANRVKWT